MASQVDLFLLGKTGQGKSSTSNSILGREDFEVSDSSESETFEVQVGWARRLNRIFKVVDGPGLRDTRLDKSKAAKKLTEDMCQGILQCPNGFHALLLVLKYGGRHTEEELETVQILKSIFGQNFVREFCILVFTHGENFDMNHRGSRQKTFFDWCLEQKGSMRDLLAECDFRVVLFYNKSPDKFDSQLQELLSLVDNLNSRGVRYTHEIFQQAAITREQLIVRENAPQLRESIQARINLLVDGLENVRAQTELNDDVLALLRQLKQDARELETDIVVQDKGTGVLDALKQVVANLLQNIDSQEDAFRERGDRDRVAAALAAAQQQFDARLAELREQLRSARNRNMIVSGLHNVANGLQFFGTIGRATGVAIHLGTILYGAITTAMAERSSGGQD